MSDKAWLRFVIAAKYWRSPLNDTDAHPPSTDNLQVEIIGDEQVKALKHRLIQE